jgi:hypothetical protein
MSFLGFIRQQPNDARDYDISFDKWFPEGDTILEVSLRIFPLLPELPYPPTYAVSPDKRTVKIWLYSGGITNTKYKIDILAITNAGRRKEVELRLGIKEN